MKTNTWFNTELFLSVLRTGYQDGITIEILSIEEIKTREVDLTSDEYLERHFSGIECAWKVRSRNTVTATGVTYEDTNIIVIPKPKMHLLKRKTDDINE